MNIRTSKLFKRRKEDGTKKSHVPLSLIGILVIMSFAYLLTILAATISVIQHPLREFLLSLLISPIGILFAIIYLIFIFFGFLSNFFVLYKNQILRFALMLIGVISFVFLFIVWINKTPLTTKGFILEKEHLDILLTFVLVLATIININVFRKQSGVERITQLDYDLNNKLEINIKNEGNYMAKDATLSLSLRKTKRGETDSLAKTKTFRKRIWRMRDLEFGKVYYKKNRTKSIRQFLEAELNIRISDKKGDLVGEAGYGNQPYFKPHKQAGSYILYTMLNYKSDLDINCPYSIVKYYKIILLSDGRFSVEEMY